MKKAIVWIILLAFVATGLAAIANSATPVKPSIRVAPPAPKFSDAERHAELARRRAAVAAKMADNSILILFSAEPKLYTNDVNYVYRQENNLYYLTALKQDNATLVIAKTGGRVTESLLIPKRVPLREAWEGTMYSHEDVTRLSGISNIADASQRDGTLTALKSRTGVFSKETAPNLSVYLLLPFGANDQNGHREFHFENELSKSLTDYKVVNAQPIFAELRHIKSPYEMKILQHAVDISIEGHMRSMAAVGRASWEYEVHAELEYTFRRRNADNWGYPSIVGCGPNATTLHYIESQSPVNKGDVMLIDAAAEYDHYTADITRSFPVTGKFTDAQKDIYQIIYDSQEAVAKATKPGVTFGNLNQVSREVIKTGLAKLGLTTGANATYQVNGPDGKLRDVPQAQLWNFHGLGHWIGMNVHDVGDYGAPLKAGMVYTNEPGIYIRSDALDYMPDTPANREFKEKIRAAFEKYKNIGVRIEDDMLVTESGVEWMSKALPRSIRDIEDFMASASKELKLSSTFYTAPTHSAMH